MSGTEIPPQWAVELFYETIEFIDSIAIAELGDIGGLLTLLYFCYKAVKRSAPAARLAGAKAKEAGGILTDLGSKEASQSVVWVSAKSQQVGRVTVNDMEPFNVSTTASAIGNATASLGL